MGRSGLPTTLVICSALPTGMPTSTVEACLAFGRLTAVPVTWITSIDRLPLVARHRDATATRAGVALEIPGTPSRQELRQLLAQAAAAAHGLDAAVIRGPLPADHRRVLVEAGIRIVCRDRFDDTTRGSRRPAPSGWPCRSTLWGLWEVTLARATPPGIVGRLLPWGAGSVPLPGSLAVLDTVGQGPIPDATAIRGRIEQWQAWAERRRGPGQTAFATLSDLPSLIAGAGRLPVGGSVLKAA
jgi:hypothetical protein